MSLECESALEPLYISVKQLTSGAVQSDNVGVRLKIVNFGLKKGPTHTRGQTRQCTPMKTIQFRFKRVAGSLSSGLSLYLTKCINSTVLGNQPPPKTMSAYGFN